MSNFNIKEYLTSTIVPNLIVGLTELSLEKPNNPDLFLSIHFFKKSGINIDEFNRLIKGENENENKEGEVENKVEDKNEDKNEVKNEDKPESVESKSSPLKFIIAGAPASGKGTQCDMLRAAVKSGSELGRRSSELMHSGKLVSDEIIIDLVKERLSQADCLERGWLLDGFPRTEAQANALVELGITPDIFLYLNVPDEILVERVVGRRTDPVTNKIYHLKFNPPPEDEEILSRLNHRDDDTEEVIKSRLEQFHSHITAVQDKYKDNLIEIDGNQHKDIVFNSIIENADNKIRSNRSL